METRKRRRVGLALTRDMEPLPGAKKAKPKKAKVAAPVEDEQANTGGAGAVENVIKSEDRVLAAMAAAHQLQKASGVPNSGQAERMMAGLELPSLAAKVLFCNDTLLLGRNLMLIGEPGSCKSAFLAEMFRWVLVNEGLAALIENENKDISDLRNSIVDHDEAMIRRILYYKSDTQEEWMRILNGVYDLIDKMCARSIKRIGKKLKKKDGETAAEYRARCAPKANDKAVGWTFPIIVGLDSITATSSEAEQGKIRDSGAPERGYSWEAQALSKLARTFPGRLRDRPILFVGTNHLKPGMDDAGQVQDNVPGGKSMRFMDTNELKLTRMGRPFKGLHEGGVTIRMQMVKNSLGPAGEVVMVDMCWRYETDPETGLLQQRTAWDWDKATIDLLMGKKAQATIWGEINDIVDLHEASQGRVWSKELGIPEAKPVKRRIAGAMLEARRDLVTALYPVLHVATRAKFKPGEDFAALMERLGTMAEDERRPLPESPYTRRDLGFLDAAGELLAKQRAELARKKKKKRRPVEDDEADAEDAA